jgi:hypothetical protein
MEQCYLCQDKTNEAIEVGNINQWGDITKSVFICQKCRENLELCKKENADFYIYITGEYVQELTR